MFRGPRGRLALPTELPSLHKVITYLLTYIITYLLINLINWMYPFSHTLDCVKVYPCSNTVELVLLTHTLDNISPMLTFTVFRFTHPHIHWIMFYLCSHTLNYISPCSHTLYFVLHRLTYTGLRYTHALIHWNSFYLCSHTLNRILPMLAFYTILYTGVRQSLPML